MVHFERNRLSGLAVAVLALAGCRTDVHPTAPAVVAPAPVTTPPPDVEGQSSPMLQPASRSPRDRVHEPEELAPIVRDAVAAAAPGLRLSVGPWNIGGPSSPSRMWETSFQISNSERPKEYEGTLVEFFALTCTPFRSFSREPGFHEVRGKSPPYSIWVTVLPFGQVPGLDAERLLAELEKRISALPRGSIDPPSCGAGG